MEKKRPKKRGRPTKFTSIDIGQVKKLAVAGWTDDQISDFFNINQSTLNRWKKSHPSFCKSLKDWKSAADEKVEKALYQRACGFEHPEEVIMQYRGDVIRVNTTKKYPPDTAACFIWLKNRKHLEWKDKQEIEHSGEVKGPVIYLPRQEKA